LFLHGIEEAAMKKLFLAVLATSMILALTGCGDDNHYGYYSPPQPLFVTTTILSDPVYDGDIQRFPVTGAFIVTQGMSPTVQSVFAGIDPASGVESRAFLDFPLTGVDGVPGSAIIDSAFLDIFFDQPLTGTIPMQVDLVSFQPPNLIGTDFDRPALATIFVSPTIGIDGQVTIDVFPLMDVAQRRGESDFQVRILKNVSPGLIEINDTTGANRKSFAPLLQVTYF
jgi:hypothetical protein